MSRPRLAQAGVALLLLGAVASLPRGSRDGASVPLTDRSPIVLGDALCRAEAYRSAGEVFARALAEARATGDRAAACDALGGLARAASGSGDSGAAERWRAEALEQARALGDRTREARLLSDAGVAAWARADYPVAERVLRQALAMQRATGDRREEALTLVRLGRVPFKQGRYDEALALYAEALTLQQRARDHGDSAATEIAIGLVHLDRRAFSSAMVAFRRALVAAEHAGDVEQRIFALDHLAIGWMFQDAPTEARPPLDEALRLARAAGSVPLEMKVLHLIANVDRQAGRLHQAIAAYGELAAFCAREGNLREAAWNRARQAKAEVTLGRLEDAKQSFRDAIATWEGIGDRRPAAFALYDLARLHVRCGEIDAALAAFERALAGQRAIALPYESLVLSDLALLEARRGRIEAARRLATDAVAAADSVGNPELRWIALFRAGRVERAAGRPEAAWAYFDAALEEIETLRAGLEPSDEAKTGFMEDKREAYAEAVDLLVELGRPDAALVVSERARARALLDLLGGARGASRAPAEAAVRETPPPGPAVHVESGALVAPPGLDAIREEARRHGATILEYSTGREHSVVFAIGPDGRVRCATIAAGAPDLARRIAALRRALAAEATSAPPAGRNAANAMLRELYQLLVAPVVGALPAGTGGRVIVVPHGPLFVLPFAGLVAPDGTYLVERFACSYAPSIGTLRAAAALRGRPPRRPRTLLAVGNPRAAAGDTGERSAELPNLPDAESEARQVAELFAPAETALLTGVSAREDRVRALVAGRAVLHFAVHAVVREDTPLDSYLALGPAPPGEGGADSPFVGRRDGRLTAREILELPIEAELVVLSGCQTGLGAITGDGVNGMSRAFLHAGAQALVVSLWRVADVVGREVMVRFEQELQGSAGRDAGAALRAAQLATIGRLRQGALRDRAGTRLTESPLYWAPFVLVGEPKAAAGVAVAEPD